MKGWIFSFMLFAAFGAVAATGPGDIIINEIVFRPKGDDELSESVELLVVGDKVNANGLRISDRNEWDKETEDQCVLNDLGQGFLSSVRSGTLIVVCNGKGQDDIDASDFVIRLYVKSSLFCNASPTANAFRLHNRGDNIHLLMGTRQLDFVKFSESADRVATGDPGHAKWERGVNGFIDISTVPHHAGFRFMGDSPELNDYLVTWRVYSADENDNVGKPNGGRNTEWINLLRAKSTTTQSASSQEDFAPSKQ